MISALQCHHQRKPQEVFSQGGREKQGVHIYLGANLDNILKYAKFQFLYEFRRKGVHIYLDANLDDILIYLHDTEEIGCSSVWGWGSHAKN